MPARQHETDYPRARPRVKVFQPVELRIEGDTKRGHLLDVSASGALVHAAQAPAAGASVVVLLASIPHGARVMWREGLRFGLCFTFRLSAAELDRILAAAAPAPAPMLRVALSR